MSGSESDSSSSSSCSSPTTKSFVSISSDSASSIGTGSSSNDSASSSTDNSLNDKPSDSEVDQVKEVPDSVLKYVKNIRDEKDRESSSSSSSSSSGGEEQQDKTVLSHAQLRKEKKAAKSKSLIPNDKTKTNNDPNNNQKKSDRKNSVWIGNMSFKTTQDNLRDFFKSAKAGQVTRVNLPMKTQRPNSSLRENRGFAYVDFSTPEAQKNAILMSEQPLLGRKLLIKDGGDFQGRPTTPTTNPTPSTNDPNHHPTNYSKSQQKILSSQKQPPAPTLFFGNLSYNTTMEGLRVFLEAHHHQQRIVPNKNKWKGKQREGEDMDKMDVDVDVVGGGGAAKEGEEGDKRTTTQNEDKPPVFIRKVRVGTFEDTGKCKGFAFVDFTETSTATSALLNPRNHRLDGRDLVVEYASTAAVQRGANKDGGGGGGGGGGTEKKEHRRPPRNIRLEKKRVNLQQQQYQDQDQDQDQDGTVVVVGHKRQRGNGEDEDSPQKKAKFVVGAGGGGGDGKRDKKYGSRPKPGAALALAKRESVAIVQSTGKKITF